MQHDGHRGESLDDILNEFRGKKGVLLAVLHRVHRSSAGRWVDQARLAVFRQTRKILMKDHRLTESETASLMRQAQSRMDLTLSSFLRK